MRANCRWAATLSFLILAASPSAAAQEQQSSAQAQPETQPSRRERRRDDPRRRMEWFYRQRAFPLGRIPPGARLKALEQMEQMRRAEAGLLSIVAPREAAAAVAASATPWTPIGPQPVNSAFFGNVSGRVTALAVNPANPDNAYLGAAEGGAWKTTDGGTTWTPLTDFQPSLAVGSIALDPTTCTSTGCSTIYVGTGEENFSIDSYYGAGILKSTDGGNTWTRLGQSVFVGPFSSGFAPGGGARIAALAVNPKNPGILLAAVQLFLVIDTGTSSGIYRSTDAGMTWIKVQGGAAGTEVLWDPNDPQGNTAYAALGSIFGDPDNGIYKSTDGGSTWTKLAGGLPTTNVGRVEIAIAPSSSGTLYAAIQNSSSTSFGTLLGLFTTTNGGTSWNQLPNTPDFCAPQCWYDLAIRAHPNNASVIYAGGSGVNFSTGGYLIRSTDGGNSWTGIANGANGVRIHVDIHALAFGFTGSSATRLYVGSDGGVWSADISNLTGAISWADLNVPLAITEFYGGHSIHPASQNIGFGGTQDNGTLEYSGVLAWADTNACGDGGWTAIDPAVPSSVYVTCENIDVEKSYQNGGRNTFAESDTGIDPSDRGEFIPPFVLDPNHPQRLYFGTFRVYQTTDAARSWTPISPDLTGGDSEDISAIAVAPSNSDVVYAGTSDGKVQVTMNASAGTNATWTNISAGLPTRFVTQIAVDPSDATAMTAYVTFSGFGSCSGPVSCDGKGHVFKTINGGALWTDISKAPFSTTPLPDTPVNDIVIDPDLANTLYVATDVGVFTTSNGGMTWSTLLTRLPNVAVLGLKLREASRTLRAATHGRSAWDLQLPDSRTFFLSSLSPVTVPAGSPNLMVAVNGGGFTPPTMTSTGSVVLWNGKALMTSFVSASQLTATVPASDLASATTAQVSVSDPSQASPAHSLPFTVTAPAPTTSSINPSSAPQGSSGFTLTVNGTNFTSNSVVRFNEIDHTPTSFSATQLTASLTANDLAVGGVYPVTVFVPPPGGGESNAQNFTVTAPPPPNDNFANAINVASTPFTDMQNTVDATTEATDPAPPCVAGEPGLVNNGRAKSIWYKFTAPAAGAVEADTIGSAYDTILSVWTGGPPGSFISVACNDDINPGIVRTSQVFFSTAAGTTYFFMISAFDGSGGATTFHVDFATPPSNDNFANAKLVGVVPFTDSENTLAATTESTDPTPTCGNGSRAKSIWYKFTPASNATVTADTFMSAYDTLLSVYTGAPGSFTPVACNDDANGTLQSQVSFPATGNTTYFFMITDVNGNGGATTFHLNSAAGPAPDFFLSASPASLSVTRGQSGSSTIAVTAAGGFSSSVMLTCSGLPSLSTCSFTPASVTPGANPATSALTISTTAASAFYVPPRGFGVRSVPPPNRYLVWAFALAALALFLLLSLDFRSGNRSKQAAAMALLLCLALAVLQGACGGGGGGNSRPSSPGTPTGTYTLTVTGTSGSSLTEHTTLTLTVN